jgi:hypothetical protein
VER